MRIFANGGGSGEKTIDIYKKIDSIIDHNKPVLYVPLAMNPVEHPYNECLEWVTNELSIINVPNIILASSFEELASFNYKDYAFIFIGGGNTYSLLKGLKDSGAFAKLKEYILDDGIVFGGSAGAVIMGKDVSCSMDNNDVGLIDTQGLDLLNGYSVFPHYTNLKSKLSLEENEARLKMFTNKIEEYTKQGNKMLAIPEEDTICVDGSIIDIVGYKPYYEFEEGVGKIINPSSSINNKTK